ncbi:hypothetical protein GOODEAATRI_000074 [Goodea atripinnis]|uniref:Orange domain-containing protein n=1 Tax=Goodea atripinnis TaxID=208336 RepID=A0ABV0MDP7_9TELE
MSKYRAGFNECMNEVTRFLSTSEGVNADVRSRLLGHLSSCMGQMMSVNYPQQPPSQPAHLAQPLHVQLPSTLPISSKLSPAEAVSPKVFGGFQLVPATDGQFAFLIPNPPFASTTTAPVIPLFSNAGVPVAVNASPVHGSSAPTAASPVHGMTSFIGGSQVVSPMGVNPGAENSEAVWRPWFGIGCRSKPLNISYSTLASPWTRMSGTDAKNDTACNWHTETPQQVTLQQLPSARRHTETPVGSMCGFCGCSSSFASELTVQRCLYGAEVVRTERTSLPAVWHDAT